MTLAVDISNYTGYTPGDAERLYDAGVRRAIVQLVNPQILTHREQIPALLSAGIEVEGYCYVWFSAGEAFVSERVAWACAELDRFPGVHKRLWLDCEQANLDDPPFDYVYAPVSPTIRTAVLATRVWGYAPGIYTARWWWSPGTNNSSEWSDLPLWDANYDGVRALTPVEYGGWEKPAMKQFQGSTALNGVANIDLNWYEVEPDVERARRLLREALGALGG